MGTFSAGEGGSDASSEEAGQNRFMESECGESILTSLCPALLLRDDTTHDAICPQNYGCYGT